MKIPQFLVVTLHSGEPDYEHCVEALKSQCNVLIKHVLISGYPEHQAHKMLYEWFNVAEPCMTRVKLDADVVLKNNDILSTVGRLMQENPCVDRIDPYVDDFLTDSMLKAGLSIYSSRVKFNEPTSPLWCDRNVTVEKHLGTLDTNMSIAFHMKYCDERTAFRYGFHRGLKSQIHVLKLVKEAYEKHKDRVRAMAIKGFELASSSQFDEWHHGAILPTGKFNYDDDWFREAFVRAVSEL